MPFCHLGMKRYENPCFSGCPARPSSFHLEAVGICRGTGVVAAAALCAELDQIFQEVEDKEALGCALATSGSGELDGKTHGIEVLKGIKNGMPLSPKMGLFLK